MSYALQARRSLLLASIRYPSRSCPVPPQAPLQVRSISANRAGQNNGFSISFGPEIDSLLKPKGKTDTQKTIDRSKNKRSPKALATRTKREASSRHLPTIQEPKSYRQDVGPEHSTDDAVTLELSDGAYDEISKPESNSTITPQASHNAAKMRDEIRIGSRRRKEASMEKILVSSKALSTKESSAPEQQRVIPRRNLEPWQIQKEALQKKFGETGWNPRKKLSPDALEGIRSLHEQDPDRYSTDILAQQFKVSAEAVRRILKSKWRPSPELMEDRRARWARRHDRIWDQKAALGLRPARRRDRSPEGPEAFEEEVRAKQMLGEL